jgi:hypothetical protein
LIDALLTWIATRAGAYRVSRTSIIRAVIRAAQKHMRTPEDIDQVGMAAGQAMFNAVMVFPKLVAKYTARLAALGTALAAARADHRSALVAAQDYLSRSDLPALTTARALLDAQRYLLSRAMRRVHVTPRLYWVVVGMLFAFDAWVFFTMYLDLFDADPGAAVMYWITVAVAAAGALITPMAVLWAADQAGARLARLNAELRTWLDDADSEPLRGRRFVSMFGKAILQMAGVLALVLLFVGIAVHRFGEHAAGIGAVQVPSWLIASLMGLIPLIATGFAFSRHDPVRQHERDIDSSWGAHQATMQANAERISATLLAWEEAWRALYALVCEIIAESNLAIQHVEHLVVHAIDRAGFGGPTPYRPEVVDGQAGWPRARYQAMLDGAATTGAYVVNAPAQLSSIRFPVPPWVQDALEIAMQCLAVNLPGAERHTDAEVRGILLTAFGHVPVTESTESTESGDEELAERATASANRMAADDSAAAHEVPTA